MTPMQEAYLKTERFQTFGCGTPPKGRGMAALINRRKVSAGYSLTSTHFDIHTQLLPPSFYFPMRKVCLNQDAPLPEYRTGSRQLEFSSLPHQSQMAYRDHQTHLRIHSVEGLPY